MKFEKYYEELKQLEVGTVLKDEPLYKHTTYRVGGPAKLFVKVQHVDGLIEVIKYCRKHRIPLFVIGRGSNLLFSDKSFDGIIISLENMNQYHVNGSEVTAQCGVTMIKLAYDCAKIGLSGFEFMGGIPGNIGGGIFMNAGAYGGEIAHILVSAQVLTKDGDIRTIDARDMRFGYRRSVLQETGEVVISAKFNLKPGDYEQIKNEMNRLNHLRELKQPLEYPSCGSVFKRPPGHFAGQLIMEANLKGHRIGGVEVSTKHAGFMVNVDHGTAKDYEDLIADVIAKVKENSGVKLDPEVRIIGDKLN